MHISRSRGLATLLVPSTTASAAFSAPPASSPAHRIDNLLAMARLEARMFTPRPEPTPPADLFRAAREALPLVLEGRSVEVDVDRECPDAFVDPSLAMEILVNLIENAARAAPPATPLRLTATRHPIESDRVRLEVLDRGPGLPATSTTADAQARRGLGLLIAKSLAEASGGSVFLAPRAGGGTVARVDLPIQREAA